MLGEKKQGFGRGFWNGFGGKVDAGESVDEALRSYQEASRRSTRPSGLLTFVYDDQSRPMEVHYHASRFTGAVETEEMRPAWWDVKDLPFGEMWPTAGSGTGCF